MTSLKKTNEPSNYEVFASVKSVRNTTLARKVFPLNAWFSYDKYQAHTWALRLIKADPKTGAEVAAALINFDYMVPAAVSKYETNARDRKRCDAILEVFNEWKAEEEVAA
jgi:hypothetical protein